jgi:hypothetical protein
MPDATGPPTPMTRNRAPFRVSVVRKRVRAHLINEPPPDKIAAGPATDLEAAVDGCVSIFFYTRTSGHGVHAKSHAGRNRHLYTW